MKCTVAASVALLLTAVPTFADPVSDAEIVVGIDICIRFGSDGWFAADRLEGAGWHGQYDGYYEAQVYTSPNGEVIVIPPPEGGGFPARCSVISGTVARDFADSAVLALLNKAKQQASLNLVDDCRVYWTPLNQEIYILSDGNEDLCTDPTTARVEVVFNTNPVGGQ